MTLPPFASVEDYERVFGASDARTDLDLDAASTVIRGFCRWHIYPVVAESVVVDGVGGSVLMLPTQHLTAVTAVTETMRGVGQPPVTLNAGDLEWSAAGMVWRGDNRCWTTRARGVSITFTHGFVDPPADLVRLVLDHANRAASNPGGMLVSNQVGQRMQQYRAGSGSSGFLEDELAVLDAYRRRV